MYFKQILPKSKAFSPIITLSLGIRVVVIFPRSLANLNSRRATTGGRPYILQGGIRVVVIFLLLGCFFLALPLAWCKMIVNFNSLSG